MAEYPESVAVQVPIDGRVVIVDSTGVNQSVSVDFLRDPLALDALLDAQGRLVARPEGDRANG